MKLKYYAFEYFSGRNTTTGDPNIKTGRISIAGHLAVFSNKSDRDLWVKFGEVTSGMQGNCREFVTARTARKLCHGVSIELYNCAVERLLDLEVGLTGVKKSARKRFRPMSARNLRQEPDY